MKVEIKVSELERDLNQAQSQVLRRMANVLRERGFKDVEIVYAPLTVIKKAS